MTNYIFSNTQFECDSPFELTDFHDIIECLVATLEAKDPYTSGHSSRVADLTLLITQELGIESIQLEQIHMAAHLHDIGKMGIPDVILQKTSELSLAEWETIKKHPQIGHDILARAKSLKGIANIVLHHHERWDGHGYPYAIKEENIPLGSRIIAIADSIDAMLYKRVYRKPATIFECIEELNTNSGTQFDPSLIPCAIKVCFQCKDINSTVNKETAIIEN